MKFIFFLKRQHKSAFSKFECYSVKFKALQYKPSELIKPIQEVDASFHFYFDSTKTMKGKIKSLLPWTLEYKHRTIFAERQHHLRNEITATHKRAIIIDAERKPKFIRPVKSKSLDYDLPKKKTPSINQAQDDINCFRKDGKYSLGFFPNAMLTMNSKKQQNHLRYNNR